MTLKLSANHKRAVSTTLTMLDELFVFIEKWVDGQCYASVLYEEKNDLSPSQKKTLKKELLKFRQYLNDLKNDMKIEKQTQSAINDIWSRVSVFRENIMELEARHMKRYGHIPQEVQEYFNDMSKKLLSQLDRILEIIK
ncbi:MAG: hypothetical protein NC937_01550 [Candidatus Omnitrophica bacterium]|nr:hypothetical protein [Candidatus Omnitrophota bacterium]MCM8822078.1 hypothetical protein [Candidatus Omnitrophota bacterium]MCM8824827.1 hypothetical protein [Candidatus Omnitrophota bacterium]MCM8828246.1 hypothetical protein [Candidatus Omnitrophota bacterium]